MLFILWVRFHKSGNVLSSSNLGELMIHNWIWHNESFMKVRICKNKIFIWIEKIELFKKSVIWNIMTHKKKILSQYITFKIHSVLGRNAGICILTSKGNTLRWLWQIRLSYNLTIFSLIFWEFLGSFLYMFNIAPHESFVITFFSYVKDIRH